MVQIEYPKQPTFQNYMPQVDVADFNRCKHCNAPVLADFEHKCPVKGEATTLEDIVGPNEWAGWTPKNLLAKNERKAVSGIPTRLGWSCHLCGASNSPDLKQCPCKIGETL